MQVRVPRRRLKNLVLHRVLVLVAHDEEHAPLLDDQGIDVVVEPLAEVAEER